MWSIIATVLGVFKAGLGWLQERAVNKRLLAAKKAGGDEAAVKGSQQVDSLVLDSERAKDDVSHAEADILNDSRNRARPPEETT